MLKKLVFIAFVTLCTIIHAQESVLKAYDWLPNPIYSIKNPNADLVALKDKTVSDFTFEGEGLVEYFLEHKILYVNSDDAIERYNKVYLPVNQSTKLEIAKARVIKKNGSVIELEQSKILTAKDEETERTITYFALEGVEKGSFVEYFYIQKQSPKYSGNRLFLQASYDKELVEFDLYSPSNLLFEFKSYNGIPPVVKDLTTTNKLHWKLRLEDIKGLYEESQSAYEAMRGAVIYKMAKNLANNQPIVSYDIVAQNVSALYYPASYTEEERKAINQFASKLKIKEDFSEVKKIRTIDSYIKLKFSYFESGGPEMEGVVNVLKNQVANDTGMLKLYIAMLRKFEIKHDLVITSNRLNLKFDPYFEANNFLTEFLFYFPNSDKYLSPTDKGTRYGFPPPFSTDNYGLFISQVETNGVKTTVSEIKYINPPKAMDSNDIMKVDVSFDEEDFTITNIQLDEWSTGYNAQLPLIYLEIDFVDKDDMNKYIQQLGKIWANEDSSAKVKNHEMIYDKKGEAEEKFIQVKFNMTSEAFVNKAGRRYLFKIGDLIGRQVEMYQEKKRVLPLEQAYRRNYDRTITVNIPEGYKVANLEDINIKNEYKENGKVVFAFHSYYKLEGNVLTVNADEYYKSNLVAPEIYEEYRTVINSAADFNKITLVLEPK